MERQETYRLTREELDRERREAARHGAETVLERLEVSFDMMRSLLASQGGKVDKRMLCAIYDIGETSLYEWLSRIGAEPVPGPTKKRNWYDLAEVRRLDRAYTEQLKAE